MSGTFTGVGVGPGDPELMTLKAVRAVEACSVIAIPVSDSTLEEPVYESAANQEEQNASYLERCVAYQIAAGAVDGIAEKDRIYLPMPMIKEKDRLKAIHDNDAAAVAELLDQEKNVVFLTLGDTTVYSTYLYVHKRILERGYEAEIVSGITSFCAVAARLNMGLVEADQPLHVIPATYKAQEMDEILELPGTKVLMKTGKKMKQVKESIEKSGQKAVMIENCGMPSEKIYRSAEEIPEDSGYYSLIIVKEN